MFNGPRVRGPALEGVPDPYHDLGDGEPVANHLLFQGRLSTPKIPDVYVRKAAVVLKYTYDEFQRIRQMTRSWKSIPLKICWSPLMHNSLLQILPPGPVLR